MKKFLSLALVMLMSICICGCQADNEDVGEIENVPTQNQSDGVNTIIEEGTLFNPQPSGLDYKWTSTNIGRAMLNLPYPKGWSISKTNDYNITFTAPIDDKYFPGQTVTFHSTLEMEQIVDIHDLTERFEEQLQQDSYSYAETTLKLTPSSSVEKYVVNKKVSDPKDNLHLLSKDSEASVLIRGTQEASQKFYHQANYFYWYDFPCVLSGVTPQENNENLNNLLTYMMSNSNKLTSEFKDVSSVTLFNSTTRMTFPMCNIYSHFEADPGDLFTAAEGFVCSSNTGTGYSQSALIVFEVPTTRFHMTTNNFDDLYKPLILQNVFGSSYSQLKLTGYMKYDDGYIDFNGTKAQEYVYSMIVNNSYNPPDGYLYGQQWDLFMYPIEHGKTTDLVCLCAPTDGMMWAFDNIKNMAQDVTYK